MEQSEKEAIRQSTDILELISRYTQLKQSGSRYRGLCPFHNEKTPSFHVMPAEGRFHCFGCSASGDVFTFLEKVENLTFIEAAQRLAEQAGITLTPRGGDREAAQRAQSERDRVFAANAAALQFYRQCFLRDTAPRAYAESRGLAHQTLENFQVGYAPEDWSQLAEYLRKQKIHPEDAEKAGLIFPAKFGEGAFTDRFRGRLLFPILDVQERVVGFGGRLIADIPSAPKYLNSPESPVFSKSRTLYGLNRARKAIEKTGRVLIVEGYMDVVAAHQAGLEFVVATLGTSLTEEHVKTIRRYTKTIVLSFDADEAGVKAALRAGELFQSSGDEFALRVLSLPAGEDPDSMLRKGEMAGFLHAVDSAVTVPEFRLKSLEKKHDLGTEQGKLALLREAVPIIAAVASSVQQDVLVRRVAAFHPSFAQSGLHAEESLRAEVRRAGGLRGGGASALEPEFGRNGFSEQRRARSGGGWNPGGFDNGQRGLRAASRFPQRPFVIPDREPIPALPAAAAAAERTLLRALLSDEWYLSLRECIAVLGIPRLPSPEGSALFAAMWQGVSTGVTPLQARSALVDPTLAELADSIAFSEDGWIGEVRTIEDALMKLKVYQEQREQEQIRARLGDDGGGNAGANDELLRQWSEKARRQKGRGQGSESR